MRHFIQLLLFVSICLVLLAWDLQRMLSAPLSLSEPAVISIPRGQSFDRVINTWKGQGWVPQRSTLYLKAYGRVSGLAARMQAGEYSVQPGVTAFQLLEQIRRGEVVEYQLTLVEGWTFEQAWAAVRAHPKLKPDADITEADQLMAALGVPDLHPEGQFRPETYRFEANLTTVAFMRRAHEAMQRASKVAWAARQQGLPLESPTQMQILASIIERETGVAAEREQIAGVFVRRLRLGMRLQTDPTVIYGLGDAFDGNLRRVDLRTDTPYNTYTRHGLPPTPICLPGRAALHAAVQPADGDTLFFVSRGDGSHQFSATVEEHNAAVRRYQLGQR